MQGQSAETTERGSVVKRAVLYLRVSTAEQVSNFSLDTQNQSCLEYCRMNGLEVDRVFREEGESAKTADRTQLQEMLAYCTASARSKGIDHVVVYKVDRLARQVSDHTWIRMTLLKLGIKLRAVLGDC
jgi:site-specific DNA recombinase